MAFRFIYGVMVLVQSLGALLLILFNFLSAVHTDLTASMTYFRGAERRNERDVYYYMLMMLILTQVKRFASAIAFSFRLVYISILSGYRFAVRTRLAVIGRVIMKTCCLFSYSTANEAMKYRDFEEIENFGGEGEGYSWGDGSQKLYRCRRCGALFLNYKIRFLAITNDSDDISYSYLLPVASRDEALNYMDKYIGSVGLKDSYKGKRIWFDGSKWCWYKYSDNEAK